MTSATAEKILKILLRLHALILCAAFFFVFIPIGWMESAHAALGLGEMPRGSIVEYLARSTSMLYALHGVIMLVIVWNPRRYWDLIPVIALVHLFLGAILLWIDTKAGMPMYWVVAEGPSIFLYSCVLIWLWKKADETDGHPDTDDVDPETSE